MWQVAEGAFKAFNPVITQLCCFCFMVRRFGFCSFCPFLPLLRSGKGMEWLRIPMMQQLVEKAVGAVRGYVMHFETWEEVVSAYFELLLHQKHWQTYCIMEYSHCSISHCNLANGTPTVSQPHISCRDPTVLCKPHRHRSVLHGDHKCVIHLFYI